MARKGLQLEALVVPIVPDIARYQKELKKVHGITTKIGRQNEAAIKKYFVNPLNLVGAAARKNFGQMGNAAAQAGAKITQSARQSALALNSMSSQMRAAARDSKRMQKEIDNLHKRLKALEKQAKRTGKAVQQSGVNRKNRSGAMDAGFALGMAGVGLTSGVTAPLVGAAGFGLKQMIEAESSFAGVVKTVNGTEKQIEGLRRGFRDMALEIPLGVNELNRIGEAAGQLGIKTEGILEFSKVMAMLGVTTNLSSDEAASALARFANITQMSQQDYGKLGSTIVHLGNQFATTEAEIVNMGLRIAGTGAQVGMSEGQILALATAASSLGLEVEMGGTAISRLINQMALATSKANGAETAFSKVAGMTGQAFQQLQKNNPAKAFEAFIIGLNRTKVAGGNVLGILEEMGIDEVRLRDTILRLASGSGVLTRALQEQHEGWYQVDALTEEANKRFATTESQLQLLWNAVVEVGIQLGEALAPALMTVVGWAKELIPHVSQLITYFTELPPWMQTTAIVIAALTAAIGPLLVGLSGMLITAGALSFAIGELGITLAGATAAAVSLGPALIVVAGAAAAFGPLLWHVHQLNMELQRSLELTGKMNEVENKRHQKVIEQAADMTPQQAIAFLSQQQAMAENELVGKQSTATAASLKADEMRNRIANAGWGEEVASWESKPVFAAETEAKEALKRQEDWISQLKGQKKGAIQRSMIAQAAPGVMGAEGVAAAEKTPIEKAREQLKRQTEMAAAMDQARAEAGLPPLHPEKPEGYEAVLARETKAMQERQWREQAQQQLGIAKPPKLTGVAAQEQYLQNKMQRESDREVAAQNLGIPPAPGPRVRSARRITGMRGGPAMMRPPGIGHLSKRSVSPYAAKQAAKAAAQAKRAKHGLTRVSGRFHAMGQGVSSYGGPSAFGIPSATGDMAGVSTIQNARLTRASRAMSWQGSDFTPRQRPSQQSVKPMETAVKEGNLAAQEKQREMGKTYDDSEIGQLKRIADNTSGLRNKTLVVTPLNLGKS